MASEINTKTNPVTREDAIDFINHLEHFDKEDCWACPAAQECPLFAGVMAEKFIEEMHDTSTTVAEKIEKLNKVYEENRPTMADIDAIIEANDLGAAIDKGQSAVASRKAGMMISTLDNPKFVDHPLTAFLRDILVDPMYPIRIAFLRMQYGI